MDNPQSEQTRAIVVVPQQQKQETYPNLNKGNIGNIGGGESKYDIKYCDEIIQFFSIPKQFKYIKREKIITKANGTSETYYEYGYKPNNLPTMEKFARQIGVDRGTLEDWAMQKYPDDYEIVEKRGRYKRPKFHRAYLRAKELQKEFLTDNGLEGLYHPAAFIFVAQNFTELRSQKPTEPAPINGEKPKTISGFQYVVPEKTQDDNTDNQANA